MSRAAVLLALVASLVLPASALAYPPPNDNWANRAPLALPSQTHQSLYESTSEATDPVVVCAGRSKGHLSVWYSFTTGPETRYVNLSTAGSDFGGALLSVYEGTPGSFRLVAGGCTDDQAATAALHGLRLRPNTSYSIELAAEDGPVPGGNASLTLTEAPVYPVATTVDGTGPGTLRSAISASNANPGAVVVPAGHYTLGGPAGEDDNASGDLDVRASMGIYGAGAGKTVIDAGGGDRVLHFSDRRGSLVVTGLTLRNGNVQGAGGGLFVDSTTEWTDIEDVAIERSRATDLGGGIASYAGGRLVRGTLSGNSSDVAGGGLGLIASGVLYQVSDSTISGNTATRYGGGITSPADLTVVNSTISANTGGGLISGGIATLRSVTVAGNAGAGVTEALGVLDVRNSVLADACAHEDGTFTAAYTHAAHPGNCDFSGAGNVTGSDPGLQPLADNGGPTLTQRVAAGSPLLDSGDPAGCVDDFGAPLALDQRGLPRAGRCDKGAFEAQPVPPVTPAPPATTPSAPAPSTPQPLRPVISRLTTVRHGRALRFTLSRPARITIKLRRGHRLVKTYRLAGRTGTNTLTVRVKRRAYTVQVAVAQGATVSRKLTLGR